MGANTNLTIQNEKVMASLCASDENEMIKWTSAIKDFHNCDVKVAADDEKIAPPPE